MVVSQPGNKYEATRLPPITKPIEAAASSVAVV
jgi:hypothetical protein